MKIKTAEMSYEDVAALPREKHKKPKKPNILFRTLLKAVSAPELREVGFTYREINMERLGSGEPCLFLMNHSSFIDLKIAACVLYPRPFNIVCTSDGFVGKKQLMRSLGCIPAKKFVSDAVLVWDMAHALHSCKSSVLMYPEASYSFDGTATPLPDSLGRCLKLLKVPVVMIRTYGAFARDPLYNNLQKRSVTVTADVEYILSADEIAAKTPHELNAVVAKSFAFDNFRWQQENKVRITETSRADYLNRVLYKCPRCLAEGKTKGRGTELVCEGCGARYELDEYGFMKAADGNTEFSHIPDWYAWQRECVRDEINRGVYKITADVDIYMMVNTDCVYKVGEGTLRHDTAGFRLDGCGGKLSYTQKPAASYSLYADYFWYEIGDMVCIGNSDTLYYCFPRGGDVAAKMRIAAEELYKITRKRSPVAPLA